MGGNKERYRELCRSEPTTPIFSRDWWLDAVCGEDWDVALVEKGGEVVGSLPYHFRRKLGTTMITMPKLTQTIGPWVRYPRSQKYYKKVSHENEVISALIDSLPPHGYFNQRLHHSQTNWLPFYWRGFEQTTRYTYLIEDLSDLDKVYNGFENDVRRNISKAQNSLEVSASEDIEAFYEVNSHVFRKQGMKMPYSLDYLQGIDNKCKENGKRRILVARDDSGETHAALYLIWDEGSAYQLMSGINPKFKSDGAAKLLSWEAIKFASGVTKRFDFEGSMLRAVESTNRSFGAVQVPYFSVTRINSARLRLPAAIGRLAPTRIPD